MIEELGSVALMKVSAPSMASLGALDMRSGEKCYFALAEYNHLAQLRST